MQRMDTNGSEDVFVMEVEEEKLGCEKHYFSPVPEAIYIMARISLRNIKWDENPRVVSQIFRIHCKILARKQHALLRPE